MQNYNKISELIRKKLEDRERTILSPYATFSFSSQGRSLSDIDYSNEFRLCFQRDRDRIIHSKPFRRLKGKTQVFLTPMGDHYRTRLTHTLEVAQISKTVARALDLNEDLAEAVALGHDLGHTPFGHFGERSLNKVIPGGFHHSIQSERIARRMNLSLEVCEGIARHSKGKGPILNNDVSRFCKTLEGQIVRVADIIAYLNHDIDDAIRAGLMEREQFPKHILKVLGTSAKQNITVMVSDLIVNTYNEISRDFPSGIKRMYMSDGMIKILEDLRAFLFQNVYERDSVVLEFNKVLNVCTSLYEYFISHQEELLCEMGIKDYYDTASAMVADYISGMTDVYAVEMYKKIFGVKSPL